MIWLPLVARILAICALVACFCSGALAAQIREEKPQIRGRVENVVARRPVPNVRITIVGTAASTETAADGTFQLSGVRPGLYQIEAVAVGFRPAVESDVLVAPGKLTELVIRLEPIPFQLDEIVVVPEYFTVEPDAIVSTGAFSNEEIRRLPGGLEDVVRAVAVLPGIVQSTGGRNDLIVRGGGPSENLYLIDDLETDNINHFGTQGATGGPLSYINLDLVRDISFSSGGFGVKYGGRLSSAFTVSLRDGRTDRIGGKLTLSATGFSTVVEGPVGPRATFIASARRSYLDLFFRAADFGFVPEYWDFFAKASYQIDRQSSVSFVGIGALDNVRFFGDTPDKRYDNAQVLGSAPRRYISRMSYERFVGSGTVTAAISRNYVNFDFVQRDTLLTPFFQSTSREGEMTLDLDATFPTRLGDLWFGVRATRADLSGAYLLDDFTTPFGDELGPAESSWDAVGVKAGVYAQLLWRIRRLSGTIGVRGDYFDLIDNSFVASPRAALAYDIDRRTSVSLSGGLYRQPPSYVWVLSNPVNRSLDFLRATHGVISIERNLSPDLKLRLESYLKVYDNYAASAERTYLVMANTGANFGGAEENFESFGLDTLISAGTGKAYGAELLLQKRLARTGLYGQVALSVGRARFQAVDGIERPGTYEQQVIINLSGGYRFSNDWEGALKFRAGSGRPYTPFRDDGTQQPADYNARRLPVFHSLDIRIDRRWFFGSWTLVAYLDVQNVYNRKNVVQVRWDDRLMAPEFSESAIGVLPSIGLSAEF